MPNEAVTGCSVIQKTPSVAVRVGVDLTSQIAHDDDPVCQRGG